MGNNIFEIGGQVDYLRVKRTTHYSGTKYKLLGMNGVHCRDISNTINNNPDTLESKLVTNFGWFSFERNTIK